MVLRNGQTVNADRIKGTLLAIMLFLLPAFSMAQGSFTIVELNTENLFDTRHDSLKNDYDFLPGSKYHWTNYRYWEKLNKIGQELIACGQDSAGWTLPDLIALCEVENDTVMRDLTKRSLLRKARYEYFITNSDDERGIDVALLYSPFSFAVISHDTLRPTLLPGMRPTRDILYVKGRIASGDTLHVFVIHAPSRRSGEKASRPYRMHVMTRLCQTIDSINCSADSARIIVIGDFNDYADSPALEMLYQRDMVNVTMTARGSNGARGTYRYHGLWGSLDHIVMSRSLVSHVTKSRIVDSVFLIEDDKKYGGVKPRRFFYGPRYNGGYSDHLPLVVGMDLSNEHDAGMHHE